MNYQTYQATMRQRMESKTVPVFRLRPKAPRGPRASAGSMEATIFWNSPADRRGVAGFRVYRDNENNLVFETKDPNTRQATIKLPGNSAAMCFVSCVSELGRESPKIPVVVQSNTDKYVLSGTGGETGGAAASTPPEWPQEPSGGHFRRYYY